MPGMGSDHPCIRLSLRSTSLENTWMTQLRMLFLTFLTPERLGICTCQVWEGQKTSSLLSFVGPRKTVYMGSLSPQLAPCFSPPPPVLHHSGPSVHLHSQRCWHIVASFTPRRGAPLGYHPTPGEKPTLWLEGRALGLSGQGLLASQVLRALSRRRTVNTGWILPWLLKLLAQWGELRPEEGQSRNPVCHRNQGRGWSHVVGQVKRKIPWCHGQRGYLKAHTWNTRHPLAPPLNLTSRIFFPKLKNWISFREKTSAFSLLGISLKNNLILLAWSSWVIAWQRHTPPIGTKPLVSSRLSHLRYRHHWRSTHSWGFPAPWKRRWR